MKSRRCTSAILAMTLILILALAGCGSESADASYEAYSIEDTKPDVTAAYRSAESEWTESADDDPETASETEETADPETTDDAETTAAFTVTDADDTVYVYNTSSLNVRTGPGTEYEAIGILSRGESVHQTGICDNGWLQIEYDGGTAYASGKYLTTDEPVSASDTSAYPMTYSDSTCTITITKEWYENAWCYIAHLEFTDYTRFGTACANGSYNNGYETTSSAASRLGAVFCVNGCYSAPYLNYPVARSGVVCNDKACSVPGVYSTATGVFSSPESLSVTSTSLSTLVSNKTVTDTFCFGPAGLVNGTVTSNSDTSRAQRTFMGTNGNAGDIYIVVSDGRYNDGESAGLTFQQCMQLLADKGCTFGIPLDGGGSSTMYFNDTVLNAAAGNERAVVDFVYFK